MTPDLTDCGCCRHASLLTQPAQTLDTVAVRSIMLPNGQPASVIMERGRIQRIVAANGQVAELRWHQSPAHLAQAYGPVRDGQPSVSITSPPPT